MDVDRKAEIEWIVGVIRVWNDPKAKYGDPYDWVATVRRVDTHSVEILVYVGAYTLDQAKAIMRECKKHGIDRILAVRYPNGAREETWLPVRDYGAELFDILPVRKQSEVNG